MSVQGIAFVPHPPVVLPEVAPEEESKIEKTFQGLTKVAQEIEFMTPKTVLLISPHGYLHQDMVPFSVNSTHLGDLGKFGASGISREFENNMELVETITEEVPNTIGYTMPGDTTVLDHGALVPLAFIDREVPFKLVYGGYSYKDGKFHYNYGEQLGYVLDNVDESIFIICSGDLSHRLSPEAPAGYNPDAHLFDEKIVEMTRNDNWEGAMELDPELINAAGECGFRSWAMFAGLCRKLEFSIDVISYEAPFGVGYMVAKS